MCKNGIKMDIFSFFFIAVRNMCEKRARVFLPCRVRRGFKNVSRQISKRRKKSLKIRISDRFGARDSFSDVGARRSNALRNSLVRGEALPL